MSSGKSESRERPIWAAKLVGTLRQNQAMGICTRFLEDGTRCTRATDNVDGWCRSGGCPGFLRADPHKAPMTFGSRRGSPAHIKATGDVVVGGVTIEDVQDVRVTTRALDSFRFQHGGDAARAEVQLRAMLEDFLLKSARKVSAGGFVVLAREGFELVLSPDCNVITGYSTVHRERTWEQVKAGVKSRIRKKKHQMKRQAAGPTPEPGPPVRLADIPRVLDPQTIHLTARVRSSYAKVAGLSKATDEDLDAYLRVACRELLFGEVVRRADGCVEIIAAGLTWLVSPDCLVLIGVKSGLGESVPSGHSPAA